MVAFAYWYSMREIGAVRSPDLPTELATRAPAEALCKWRRYLVHMVQLDAAAMNLKRRFEDPNIAASLEAQQAYTRALAPGGEPRLPRTSPGLQRWDVGSIRT